MSSGCGAFILPSERLKCNHRDDEYVSIFHIFLGPNFVGGFAVAQVIEWVFYQSEGSTMHVLKHTWTRR